MAWVRAQFVNYKKRCTRLAAASDKVYQLLAHGQWFSPASSTTKTGLRDIAESGVKTPKINWSIWDIMRDMDQKTRKQVKKSKTIWDIMIET